MADFSVSCDCSNLPQVVNFSQKTYADFSTEVVVFFRATDDKINDITPLIQNQIEKNIKIFGFIGKSLTAAIDDISQVLQNRLNFQTGQYDLLLLVFDNKKIMIKGTTGFTVNLQRDADNFRLMAGGEKNRDLVIGEWNDGDLLNIGLAEDKDRQIGTIKLMTKVVESGNITKRPKLLMPAILLAIKRYFYQKFPRLLVSIIAILVFAFLLAKIPSLFVFKPNPVDRAILEAERNINNATSLQTVNRTVASDTLSSSKKEIAALLEESLSGKKSQRDIERLKKELEKINQTLQGFTPTTTLPPPKVYYDFSLVKEMPGGAVIAFGEKVAAVVEKSSGAIVTLNLKTKEGKLVGKSEEGKTARFAALYGDYLYFFSPTGGIYRFSFTAKNTQLIIKPDTGWGEVGSLVVFGGNIYLLDKTNSRIWKYVATESGFTERREYLTADTKPDFSRAEDMFIDGSVYVLFPDKIQKYAQGRTARLSLKGAMGEFSGWSGVFVDGDKIYIFSKNPQKILVFSIEGEYLETKDLSASPQTFDKVFGLYGVSGTKLYTLY